MSVPVVPQVVEALSIVRQAVRTSAPAGLVVLYPMLCELAGLAFARLLPVGQPSEVSQHAADPDRDGANVRDRWLPPKEGARRLGRGERWLRRRRWKLPYSKFCIAVDSGRGWMVSERGLDEFMESERRRAAR